MKRPSIPDVFLRAAACLAALAFVLPGAVFAADHTGHDQYWGKIEGWGTYSNGTKFYLADDVVSEGSLQIGKGQGTEMTLCLAGHVLLLRSGNTGGQTKGIDLQVSDPLVIEDCVGTGSIQAADGAKIQVNSDGTLTLRGVKIESGITVYGTLNVEEGSNAAGPITVKSGATANITGSAKVNLTVETGGTVNIAEGAVVSGSITVDGGTLEAKNATLSSGLVVNSGAAALTDTTVTGKNVTVNGGSCTITGGRIENVNSSSDGGGVYVAGGECVISGTVITGNTAADNGGGICVASGGSCTINEGGVTITDNTAQSGSGGGIHVASGGRFISNGAMEISSNTAHTDGGGLYAAGSQLIVNSSAQITGNTAETGSGGGVCLAAPASDGSYSLSGAVITGNEAKLGNGGGLYVGSGTKVFHQKSAEDKTGAISFNTAWGNGGGVYVAEGAELTVGADIEQNIAGSLGGGIYGEAACTINIHGSSTKQDEPVIYLNKDSSGYSGIYMAPNLNGTEQWTVNFWEGVLGDKGVFWGADNGTGALNIEKKTTDDCIISNDLIVNNTVVTITSGDITSSETIEMNNSMVLMYAGTVNPYSADLKNTKWLLYGGYCEISTLKTDGRQKVYLYGGYFDAPPRDTDNILVGNADNPYVMLEISGNEDDPNYDPAYKEGYPYGVYAVNNSAAAFTVQDIVYDGQPVEEGVDFTLSPAGTRVLEYSCTDAEGEPVNGMPTDAGTYTIRAKCLNTGGTWYAETSFSLTIDKADPTYTTPSGLTGLHGHTLAEVALPEGWAWKDGTAAFDTAGEKTFAAVFTPADTANYNTVEKQLTVTVEHDWGAWEPTGSGTHTGACQCAGCTASVQENCSGGTAGYFTKAVCSLCGSEYGDFALDTTAPEGVISIQTNQWKTFLEKITFELFFKDTQTVTITAHDDSCDEPGYTSDKAASIGYLLHRGGTALSLEELKAAEFTSCTGPFSIRPDDRLVVYAKITDHAGNVTYINSDGLVLDGTAPAVTGVENGVCYVTQAVTAADENLDKVTVNGVQVQSAFTLAGNVEETYVITAADKAGNVTTVTVAMKPISALEEAVKDLTADTVAFENEAALTEALTAAKGVDLTDATQAEQEELSALITRLEGLLEVLNEARAVDEAVAALPDEAEPDDSEAEADILAAKAQFDALTAHQQQLIPEAAAKLEKLLADLKDYRLVQGSGSIWRRGSEDLTFTANGPLNKFTGVLVDGKTVDAANYTAASGSTVLTLKKAFLETLAVGTHTLTVQYTDGEAAGTFGVMEAGVWTPSPTATPVPAAESSGVPATGEDGPLMWAGLLVFSAAALAAVWGFGRRSGKK